MDGGVGPSNLVGQRINQRLARAVAMVPLALTVSASILAVVVEPDRPYALLLPLAAATTWWGHAGWRWVAARPSGRLGVVGYLAGLWLFDAALILIDPVFVVAAIAGLVAAPMLTLDWRGFPGVLAFSVLINVLSNPPAEATAWAVAVMVVLVQTVLLGGAGRVSRWIEDQSEQRRRAVVALEQAAAENARLQAQIVEQARTAGAVTERTRVAREIHDTLAQGLVGVLSQIEAARSVDGVPGPARAHLTRAADLSRSTLDDARRSLHTLRPAPLAGGLSAAISGVVAGWGRDTGVDVDLRLDPPPATLIPAVEVALLRGVQEALANVARHAGASKVVVTLTVMDDAVALDIHDDGRGFTLDSVGADSYGLTGMRERVTALGGRVEVESAPGSGTTLSILLPHTGSDTA